MRKTRAVETRIHAISALLYCPLSKLGREGTNTAANAMQANTRKGAEDFKFSFFIDLIFIVNDSFSIDKQLQIKLSTLKFADSVLAITVPPTGDELYTFKPSLSLKYSSLSVRPK